MFNSSLKNTIVVFVILFFVNGCAELKLITSSSTDEQASKEQPSKEPLNKDQQTTKLPDSSATTITDSTKDNEQLQQGDPAAVLIQDPMQKLVLPASLLKGYKQVSQMLAQQKTTDAITRLRQLKVNHPKFSGASYRLARVYQNQKDYKEAIKSVEESLQINPNNYYALNLKGILLREQGQFEDAKIAYQEAIKIYPDYPQGHLNLAILADIFLYDFELALQEYRVYMSLVDEEDKKVSGWIIDLKRRMPKGN